MANDPHLACGMLLWGVLVLLAKADISKQRLCIQYEVADYNSSMIPQKKLFGMSWNSCFVQCVRHQPQRSPCRAFHFRQEEGVCELLPEDIKCMADNMTPGTTYVHLSDCEAVVPWRGINPNPGPLEWVTVRSGVHGLRSPLGGLRYVVRVVNKGLWLTGYGELSKAKVAGPDGVTIICSSNIQYLKSSDPEPFSWVSFSMGDPIPAAAIVGGYWPNGTPLYIVRVASVRIGTLYAASYNADSLQIRPKSLSTFRSGSLRILVNRG